jgi:hypothetical protein
MHRRGAMVLGSLAVAAAVALFFASRRPLTDAAPVLTVRMIAGPRTTVPAGMPMVAEVFLTARRGQQLEIGSRLSPWSQRLALEWTAGRSGTLKATVARVASRVASTSESGRTAVTALGPEPVARVSGLQFVHRADLVIDEAETAGMPDGTYQLRATFQTPRWQLWGWRGRVESGTVRIVISSAVPDAEAQRNQWRADTSLRLGRLDAALQAAQTLVRLQPERSRAYRLLGDVMMARGDRAQAVHAYTRALDLVADGAKEPPKPIMERAAAVRLLSLR